MSKSSAVSKTVATETKRWTVLNARSSQVEYLTDKEFKYLLDNGGVKLKGEYMPIHVYHNQRKVWIDAIIHSDNLK